MHILWLSIVSHASFPLYADCFIVKYMNKYAVKKSPYKLTHTLASTKHVFSNNFSIQTEYIEILWNALFRNAFQSDACVLEAIILLRIGKGIWLQVCNTDPWDTVDLESEKLTLSFTWMVTYAYRNSQLSGSYAGKKETKHKNRIAEHLQ